MALSLVVAKVIATVLAVLGLSLAAEHASPNAAGLFSGYPMGAAIVLFFYGLEVNPQYAADSAIYTLVGLVACQSFMYFYYRFSLYFRRFTILFSTLFSLSGYFIISWLLHFIPLGRGAALATVILSLFVFIYLFRDIKNVRITNKVRLTHKILLVRALLGASLIILVIGVGTVAGSTWARLLSAFPGTFLPLILIIHYTYDKEHVHTIIKNVPRGLGAVIIYVLTVSFAYPIYGIYQGTVMAFMAATLYMLIYLYTTSRLGEKVSDVLRNVE